MIESSAALNRTCASHQTLRVSSESRRSPTLKAPMRASVVLALGSARKAAGTVLVGLARRQHGTCTIVEQMSPRSRRLRGGGRGEAWLARAADKEDGTSAIGAWADGDAALFVMDKRTGDENWSDVTAEDATEPLLLLLLPLLNGSM